MGSGRIQPRQLLRGTAPPDRQRLRGLTGAHLPRETRLKLQGWGGEQKCHLFPPSWGPTSVSTLGRGHPASPGRWAGIPASHRPEAGGPRPHTEPVHGGTAQYAPPHACVCVSPSRQSGSCTARSTDPFTMPKTHPAWQEGKLRPAAQICIGLVPNEPWDITAGISQQAGSPRAGVRMGGTPGRGCQKPHQAQPGQGKELIPLLAGSQMATAPIPQLSRFKR